MSGTPTVVLSTGGMRSFTALASLLSGQDHPRVVLLHLLDGRTNTKTRSAYVHRQAQHLGLEEVLEIELPRVKIKPADPDHQPLDTPALLRAHILVNAVARTIELGGDRLVWPAQSNGQFPAAAKVTEQAVLISHMAKLEYPYPPTIETPLLELTDQQLIELGGHLDLPWDQAWSCQMQGDRHCRVCEGCRRRIAGFESAGLIDPVMPPVPVH